MYYFITNTVLSIISLCDIVKLINDHSLNNKLEISDYIHDMGQNLNFNYNSSYGALATIILNFNTEII